ncbi:hypothetical protein D9615_000567 [Tricholomella constricta]|uniref:Uncharacterized protein n=1 Tax=Tricholomella constricta TaxID=117010 RepID=A0A8H5MBR1_9AGAR|nr:hypothetical protein D9615_000567 [Tricholomella constricta]
MDNQEIDEDSIDLDALQAQIDMSMSFAQEMVSTWVKSSRRLPSRSSRDIEAELKEYMRRPPRLGVGAAIPETHNSSREAARLKGQLIGKGNKRSRDDEPDAKEKSEDEEESRAGAIRKKARVDPFGDYGGKKKNKKKKLTLQDCGALAPLKRPVFSEIEAEEVVSGIIEDTGGPSTPATLKRKKRKKSHSTDGPSTDSAIATESSIPMSPRGAKIPDNSLNTPERTTAGLSNTPKVQEPINVSSIPATPLHILRQAQSAALLKQPLLNLAPLQSDGSEGDTNNTPGGSSKKKKRKRQKKKKSAANESTAEAATADITDVP